MAKRIKQFLMSLCVLALNTTNLSAQVTVCTSGGDADGNGSISFTVGQPFYIEANNYNGTILPGVQQTYLISRVETANVDIIPSIQLKIYPNPTANDLSIVIDNGQGTPLYYLITDNLGRKLRESEINHIQTNIDISSFAPSVYYLQIYNKAKRLKTFKIVKIR